MAFWSGSLQLPTSLCDRSCQPLPCSKESPTTITHHLFLVLLHGWASAGMDTLIELPRPFSATWTLNLFCNRRSVGWARARSHRLPAYVTVGASVSQWDKLRVCLHLIQYYWGIRLLLYRVSENVQSISFSLSLMLHNTWRKTSPVTRHTNVRLEFQI